MPASANSSPDAGRAHGAGCPTSSGQKKTKTTSGIARMRNHVKAFGRLSSIQALVARSIGVKMLVHCFGQLPRDTLHALQVLHAGACDGLQAAELPQELPPPLRAQPGHLL